jgi:biopolymer transport protein ExbD
MRLAKRHGTKLEINMTPMIDVTFLLLIFFMTVNQVSKANRERMPLPLLAGSKDQSDAELIINIDRDDNIIVSPQFMSLGELAFLIADKLKQVNGDRSRLTVLMRVHREVNCRMVNEIVSMLDDKFQINHVNLGVEVPR